MTPFFTIITATRNAAATLPRLLDSLAGQSCRDFELLLQDGASTDNTVAIAEAYRERLPALSLVSEPDTGIYDAWNRALPRIRGEWVLFLGADDRLAEQESLQHVYDLLHSADERVLYAAGDVAFFTSSGVSWGAFSAPVKKIVHRLRREMPFCHTGLFHKKILFADQKFDTAYRVLGDYEFLCKTLHDDTQVIKLPILATHMFLGGVSDRLCNQPFIFKESVRIAKKYFSRITRHHIRIGCIVLVVNLLCRMFGSAKAAKFVDMTRKWRGKPPRWHQTPSAATSTSSIGNLFSQNVSVVILNYQNAEDTIACLHSLQTMPDKPGAVIIVDNGSKDDSLMKIRTWLGKEGLPFSCSNMRRIRCSARPAAASAGSSAPHQPYSRTRSFRTCEKFIRKR